MQTTELLLQNEQPEHEELENQKAERRHRVDVMHSEKIRCQSFAMPSRCRVM